MAEPLLKPVPPISSELGKLRYAVTTFRHFAHDCERIVERIKCNNPWGADQYQAMADTWNCAAQIIEELLEPRTGYGGDLPDMGVISRNAKLVERLLFTMTLTGEQDAPEMG